VQGGSERPFWPLGEGGGEVGAAHGVEVEAAGGGHRRLSGHDLLFLCAVVQAGFRAGAGEVHREEIETLPLAFLFPFIGREGLGERGEATPFSVDKLKFVD
jgi:hypothetical protein